MNKKLKPFFVTLHNLIQRIQANRKRIFPRPDFLDVIKARALMFGKRIGVKYAEGYLTTKMIGVKSFDALYKM